ncbi:MAG TPA: carbohydrate ABC transporter permease [Phycisphaerae bacterium]|nr:carbohydrate ABC transporter permease [Phycisphaerae bacterium]
MSTVGEKRPAWHLRLVVHLVLITGGLFFLLPLVWMIATSLKPLDQTLQRPDDLATAFLATGYRAAIDGKEYEVTRERPIDFGEGGPMSVVRPKEAFSAGELTLPFGPDTWRKSVSFTDEERRQMDAAVTPGMKVLADDTNPFDPNRGTLKLRSGRVVPAELVRRVAPPPSGEKLYLVREWRSSDTDTKGVSSPFVKVDRAWAILPESAIRQGTKFIPNNYPVALRRVHFGRTLGNTLFLCVMAVGGTVVASVIVAYGFAFLEFPGRNALFALTLATIMVPFVVTMIPVYLLYRNLGWVGTFKPLWVTTWFGNAFFIFLLRQFFLGLPKDLLDAARIDGCSELEILWNVVVPLARPVIAMVALFTFLGTWKDFLGPLIYLSHEKQFTLSLSLQAFASEHGGTPWHLLMAASTVFSLPLIVLFFFAMKTFIRSVAMTGIKG